MSGLALEHHGAVMYGNKSIIAPQSFIERHRKILFAICEAISQTTPDPRSWFIQVVHGELPATAWRQSNWLTWILSIATAKPIVWMEINHRALAMDPAEIMEHVRATWCAYLLHGGR